MMMICICILMIEDDGREEDGGSALAMSIVLLAGCVAEKW